MDDNLKTQIQKTAEGLFEKLDLPVKLSLQEENETLKIDIDTENPGLLIGFHGETLSSLQLILSLMVYKKTGQWTHVSLNVGDYRQRREEQLREMVQRIIETVKSTGQPTSLPYLPSNERRIVHLMVQEKPDVVSESEGEGQNRRVVIKPKTP